MRLSPTAEQQELKDAVRRFCAEQVTAERLAVWEKEPSGVDETCWRAVASLGWLGLVDVACVLEECARGLIPRRVINAIRGAQALAQALAHVPADASAALAAVGRGASSVALALDEERTRDPARYETRIIAQHDAA